MSKYPLDTSSLPAVQQDLAVLGAQFVTHAQLLKILPLLPRRPERREEFDWPPPIMMGKKKRVYFIPDVLAFLTRKRAEAMASVGMEIAEPHQFAAE